MHKYVYGHGDPIGSTDPTGKFAVLAGTYMGLMFATAATGYLRATDASVKVTALTSVLAWLAGYVAMQALIAIAPNTVSLIPKWYRARDVPSKAANITLSEYEENVYQQLKRRQAPGIDPNTGEYRTLEDIEWGARAIAKQYVRLVYDGTEETIDEGTRVGNFFGTGGWSGWSSNFLAFRSTNNCDEWCDAMQDTFNEEQLRARGWVVQRMTNSRKYGDHAATHNYFIVGFRIPWEQSSSIQPGEESPQTRMGQPHAVLDPWIRGRPDVYSPRRHFQVWPAPIVDPDMEGSFE